MRVSTAKTDVEDIEVDEDGPPEHVWADIALPTLRKVGLVLLKKERNN